MAGEEKGGGRGEGWRGRGEGDTRSQFDSDIFMKVYTLVCMHA